MFGTRMRLGIMAAAALLALAAYAFIPPPGTVSAATPGAVAYTYDSLGRVITDTNTGGNSGAYSYDAAGNRTSASMN